MHELSIALSIVELASNEARERGGVRVSAVHLKLGQLSGVAKDSLLFSYELACEGTILQGSRLVIQEIAPVAYCPTCKAERALDSAQHFCCSVCGSLTPELVQGKELEVLALEISEDISDIGEGISDEFATATGRG
jgi:hydrogenase nickel incorporation protein HypA/HybF